MRDVCTDFECELREFNGESSHVHLLVNFPPAPWASVTRSSVSRGRRLRIAVMRSSTRCLERVREELTDAEAGEGATVTAIAERWGFNHLGSFAVLYRKRWGESPSQTLHQ
jgi:REP element-mobilizing transposase RayT